MNIEEVWNLPVQISNIKHENVAYVETCGSDTTGTLNMIGRPFATINKALDSLPLDGGVIKIGIGTFSPMDINKVKSNVSFIGAQMPKVDSDTAPTCLVGGSVVQGNFYCIEKQNIKIFDLGVDSGLNVCNSLYGGVAQNGLGIGSSSDLTLKELLRGIEIKNVVTLCKDGSSPIHSCIIEGVEGANINNVRTYFGMHGFVYKGVNSNVSNIIANGSGNNIIIKNSKYAPCNKTNFNNLLIDCSKLPGGGLLIQSEDNTVLDMNNIENLVIDSADYGINFVAGSTICYNNITNTIIRGCKGDAIKFNGNVFNNEFHCWQVISPLKNGILFSESTNNNRFVDFNMLASQTENTGSGMFFNGANNELSNFYCTGFKYGGIECSNTTQIFNNVRTVGNGGYDLQNIDNVLINNGTIPKLPTFLNNWVNYDSNESQTKFYKQNNTIFIEGLIKGGIAGQQIFVLPTGFNPLNSMRFICRSDTGICTIVIHNNGEVMLETGNYSYISLDGICFYAN